jgi:hypothetical protein
MASRQRRALSLLVWELSRPARVSPGDEFDVGKSMSFKAPSDGPRPPRLRCQGVTFDNYLVNVSLCCPTRSTILRGQLSQNTRIKTNEPPEGGHARFQDLGWKDSTWERQPQSASWIREEAPSKAHEAGLSPSVPATHCRLTSATW